MYFHRFFAHRDLYEASAWWGEGGSRPTAKQIADKWPRKHNKLKYLGKIVERYVLERGVSMFNGALNLLEP